MSICLWTKPCPLCIFHNTCPIHFICAHLIKQLQKVYHVQRLLQNLNFWQIFGICNFDCLFMTWDLMWITSMGNPGAAGDISECGHSSCSSLGSLVIVRLLIESFFCVWARGIGYGVVGWWVTFYPSIHLWWDHVHSVCKIFWGMWRINCKFVYIFAFWLHVSTFFCDSIVRN